MKTLISSILLIIVFASCKAQTNKCQICGTYQKEESEQIIKINDNGTWTHHWRNGESAANLGLWEIKKTTTGNFIILYLPKKEKEKQVFVDFPQNKINKNDYYTDETHKDFKMEFGTNGQNQQYVKWANDKMFYKK